MDEPTAGSELVCVCATKISNPACILHPEAMGSCFSQQFLRKTMRGRIKISCPVTCVKIECVCISLGARQRRIIGSQSPSRKGRHNTNMTLFIEGEDINCSRGLKKMLGEDGVTCCLEFPVTPHFWRWAPIGLELLTRNVSYLESSVISRSWRNKGHTGHPDVWGCCEPSFNCSCELWFAPHESLVQILLQAVTWVLVRVCKLCPNLHFWLILIEYYLNSN